MSQLSHVCTGVVYGYLSKGAGKSKETGAFRALSRGFQHWSSGRIERIQVNLKHPQFCHVKSHVQPSMKQGMYEVYVLLRVAGECGEVASATCDCAAG